MEQKPEIEDGYPTMQTRQEIESAYPTTEISHVELAEAVVRHIYNRNYGTAEYVANSLRNKLRRTVAEDARRDREIAGSLPGVITVTSEGNLGGRQ